ncbi:MAG: tRNA (N6-isopentenyl adenosine(37)-C2)-methylthiotransferase MiaB [Firmicutes bacterium]|nr:tRNA (N6-isopentenyl adenosine(37)-C2)-methylthiotransferase MiaB [Bacillota bacterium]
MKYLIQTFGCQMNEHDSEIIAGMLQEMGYQPTTEITQADLVLLNTCCVRETAENKIYGKLGELKHLKRQKPDLLLVVCGCMTQQEQVAEKLAQRAPHVDVIIGTHNTHRLPELLAQARATGKTVIDVWEKEGEIIEDLPTYRQDGIKAYVTIMYGCNNFCSYCIVPYVRGRERSRRLADIVAEVERLAQAGYKEVMLLGQNVNSYGKDLAEKVDFADLLARLDRIPGIKRIRYMTSHPRDFSDKLIEMIASSSKVCEHFHLPIQAGSNAVLKRMNRGYTREYYQELVAKIRHRIPHCSVTTDLIVGFPGESDQDFHDTLELVRNVRFDAAYTFVYSKRSGTPADKMPNQVPLSVKKSRLQQLMHLQNKISREINEALIGQDLEVLVDGESKTNRTKLSGRTRTNKIVIFSGPSDLIGQLVPIRITAAQTWNLIGEWRNDQRS